MARAEDQLNSPSSAGLTARQMTGPNYRDAVWERVLTLLLLFQVVVFVGLVYRIVVVGFSPIHIIQFGLAFFALSGIFARRYFSAQQVVGGIVVAMFLLTLPGVAKFGLLAPALVAVSLFPVAFTLIWGALRGVICAVFLTLYVALIGYLTVSGHIEPVPPTLDYQQIGANWSTIVLAVSAGSGFGIFLAWALNHSWARALAVAHENRRALDAEQRHTQAILSNLVDVYFRMDLEGRFRLASPSIATLLGVNSADMIGRDIREFSTNPSEIQTLLGDACAAPDDSHEAVLHLTSTAGENKVVRVRGKLSARGRAFEGVIYDRTRLEITERNLETARAQWESVAENMPGALYNHYRFPDGRYSIEYLSPLCEEVWEIDAVAARDKPGKLLYRFSEADQVAIMDMIVASGKHMQPWQGRFRAYYPDGREKWLDFRARPHKLSQGILCWHSLALDVTAEVEAAADAQRLEDLANQAQKHESIGKLTGGVAHDFNNLLAVVLGNLELLRDGQTDAGEKELTDTAIKAALRGADLTKNMLSFARRARLEPKTIKLNDMVRDTQNWIGRTLPANIEVALSTPDDLWPIEADVASTESALLNLILNARDAMPQGGALTIETSNEVIEEDPNSLNLDDLLPGNYVLLSVSDTGHGIDPATIKSIFEPFFTTKPPGAGSGLGLSMIHGFMNQSGGTVRVYSEAGVGSTFKLYFRALNTQDAAASPGQGVAPKGVTKGAKILVAEDEPDVLRLLKTALSLEGYDVQVAASGDEAFEVFEATPDFDLLLTDIVMPGKLQGTDLARVLREAWPDLPVVFMSGYAREATVHGNGLRPEDVRLMKPARRADLIAAIEQSLLVRKRKQASSKTPEAES